MLIVVLAIAIVIVVAANAWLEHWERKQYQLRQERLKQFSAGAPADSEAPSEESPAG